MFSNIACGTRLSLQGSFLSNSFQSSSLQDPLHIFNSEHNNMHMKVIL